MFVNFLVQVITSTVFVKSGCFFCLISEICADRLLVLVLYACFTSGHGVELDKSTHGCSHVRVLDLGCFSGNLLDELLGPYWSHSSIVLFFLHVKERSKTVKQIIRVLDKLVDVPDRAKLFVG